MADLFVIDFKSSNSVYDEYLTQVSCYLRMYNHSHWKLSDPWEPATRAGILRLDKETGLLDDPAVVEVTDIEERWQAFLGLREYYRHILEPKAKQDRWYKDGDKRYVTITTVLGCLDKPALVQWAANMTVEYFKENAKDMTTPEQIEYHLKKAKTAYRTMSKKAMDIGSIVHDAIHAYLSGAKPEPILEGQDKAQNSFLAFLEWADKVKLKPVALEKVLIDPVHEVGGTCDFIGWAEI